MRTIYAATIAMATITTKPWGIQVAGNFRRAAGDPAVAARRRPLQGGP